MRYNTLGQNMTGFENSIDHSMFGHWSNPEYQELCQQEFIIDDLRIYEESMISINTAYDYYIEYLNL